MSQIIYNCAYATVAGIKHDNDDLKSQDFACYRRHMHNDCEYVIGAIADGLGSKLYSRKGAEIATKKYIDSMIKFISFFGDLENQHDYIKRSIANAIQAEIRKKSREENREYSEYGCTLLTFCLSANGLMAFQIGDGQIVAKERDREYQLLFQPIKGEFANETVSVTGGTINNTNSKSCYKKGVFEFIALSTDGIERISLKKDYSKKEYLAYQPFFSFIQQDLNSRNGDEWSNHLALLLRSQKVAKKSDDDKTLLICILNASYKQSIEEEIGGVDNDRVSRDIDKIISTEEDNDNNKIIIKTNNDVTFLFKTVRNVLISIALLLFVIMILFLIIKIFN
jgi:Protein phosphatase 2C